MKYELRLHRVMVGILILFLGGFIGYCLHLRPVLAHARFETIGALFVVTIAAAVFVTVGIIESTMAFQFGRGHRRELLTYLFLGFISLGSGLYLAISATSSLQTVALVASPHAFLFGLAELRAARHLERHPKFRLGLRVGGLVEILLGLALIFGASLPAQEVVSLLIYVAAITILQLVPFVFFRFPHAPDAA
jgi:hypothetical protein